ncbi:MAG: ferrochelatase [Gemmatimonadales bacterium]
MGKSATGPDTGILLMAYGTSPTTEERDVRNFLRHIVEFYRAAEPTDEAVEALRKRLIKVGGSPLYDITARVAASLQQEMDRRSPGAFVVRTAMKHSPPHIGTAVQAINRSGVRRAVAVALAPFSSRLSTEGYYRLVTRSTEEQPGSLYWKFAGPWHIHPLFVQLWEKLIQDARCRMASDPLVVFTNHSLPVRVTAWNDPYPAEFNEAASAIANRCGLERWTTAYQSAGTSGGGWLGPSLDDVLRKHASQGCREFLVAPVGFLTDHLEILYDLDVEAQSVARRLGVRLDRTAMPNDGATLVELLANIVLETLAC